MDSTAQYLHGYYTCIELHCKFQNKAPFTLYYICIEFQCNIFRLCTDYTTLTHCNKVDPRCSVQVEIIDILYWQYHGVAVKPEQSYATTLTSGYGWGEKHRPPKIVLSYSYLPTPISPKTWVLPRKGVQIVVQSGQSDDFLWILSLFPPPPHLKNVFSSFYAYPLNEKCWIHNYKL